MKHFIYQLRRVKLHEIIEVWKLPIALFCAVIYRLFHSDLWIVCEDKNEARDNGYWFFKYICDNHPEQECIYAILRTSPDFEKVKKIGKTVQFGSLKHWILYFASSKKISSQKAGNPNAAIFYFLEVYGFYKDKRVFLQHGITKDDAKWLYYNVTKMNRFICGAQPEYEFIKENFGYPSNNVVYTGFCRFDNLHSIKMRQNNIILIMPTWRAWIADEDRRLLQFEGTTVIPKTNYFISWNDFLKDKRLEALAQRYKVKFIFFPHRNMQKYMEYFPRSNDYLEVADAHCYDVQELMKQSMMMITDYSSVFFDMIYMKKPIIFYQFDYEKFRIAQYSEGYFNYKDNPFGKSCLTKDDVFFELETCIKKQFKPGEAFLKAHKEYFRLFDSNNCKRIYDIVQKL